MSRDELADLFLKTWHPIVELEQISPHSLAEAMRYWKNLLPLSERWQKPSPLEREVGFATREDMIRQRILTDESFSQELERFWEELKHRVAGEGRIRYWDFVGAKTYSETIRRAYLASFLVTYGYATLQVYRLEDETFIKPLEKPLSLQGEEQLISIPISVSFDEWMRWKEGELD
jgi:hypothetical protein